MSLKVIKCPICNKVIRLDKIKTDTVYGHTWSGTSHSCPECKNVLIEVVCSDKVYLGSLSPNDHHYAHQRTDIKVFDCIEKDYVWCKGYKVDIGGGLYAIREDEKICG